MPSPGLLVISCIVPVVWSLELTTDRRRRSIALVLAAIVAALTVRGHGEVAALLALGVLAAHVYHRWRYISSIQALISDSTPLSKLAREGKVRHSYLDLRPYDEAWKTEADRERGVIMEALQVAGVGKHLLKLTDAEAAILLPPWHPNDGSPAWIGSSSIRGVALAQPAHDQALMVDCDPFELPAAFAETMQQLGYVCMGCAPHNPNGHDQWWLRVPPGPKATGGPRFVEKHDGFCVHVAGPKAHEWFKASLAFSRYLEENREAHDRYMAVKRKHWEAAKQRRLATPAGVATAAVEAENFLKYKIEKNNVGGPMLREACEWAKPKIRSSEKNGQFAAADRATG